MAHASCINGHCLWNGDGGPCVEAYRVDYIRGKTRENPDLRIRTDPENLYLYDLNFRTPSEDLDIWFCDECDSFFVYKEQERYDYVPCQLEDIEIQPDWEEYIAIRDAAEDWDTFHDFTVGKTPLEALLSYGFEKRYYLSPDKKFIVARKITGEHVAVYEMARYIDFSEEHDEEK